MTKLINTQDKQFKNKKIKFVTLFFSFFIIFYLANVIFSNELDFLFFKINWFNQSLYSLNYYDYGFIKRGLVATVFNINSSNLTTISTLLGIFIVIIIITLYIKIILEEKLINNQSYLILFGVSPFFFQYLGYDLGRFDHYGICFMLLTTYFVITNKNIFILELMMPFFLLITEVHFFTSTIFFIYIQFILKRPARYITLSIALTFLIMLIIISVGEMSPELIKKNINNYAIDIYFNKGGFEGSVYFWKLILDFSRTGIYRHLLSIIAYIIICYWLAFKLNDKKLIFLFIIYFPIFILGIDHARFLSIFLINMVFITIIKQINFNINFKFPKFKKIFYLIVLVGPWGVGKAMPIITVIKKFIVN